MTTANQHNRARQLNVLVSELHACRACPRMIAPVVSGQPVLGEVMLIGQAPGVKEGPAGKPFAWTAGKTLFKWFGGLGVDEATFRTRAYMAAVCRCFPGKNPKGGDRVPDGTEIAECSRWLAREVAVVQPALILPVGKLAISQLMNVPDLASVIGTQHRVTWHGHAADVIPLPHPSGASTWHRMEPGKTLLAQALALVGAHPAWQPLRSD